MVTYQEYRAAVERLRRVASESASGVYADVFVDSDKLTIYDAEHDQTPASVEWLRDVLGEPNGEFGNMIIWRLSASVEIRVVGSLVRFMANIVSEMCRNPTRGDAMTALRLFKKEGAA